MSIIIHPIKKIKKLYEKGCIEKIEREEVLFIDQYRFAIRKIISNLNDLLEYCAKDGDEYATLDILQHLFVYDLDLEGAGPMMLSFLRKNKKDLYDTLVAIQSPFENKGYFSVFTGYQSYHGTDGFKIELHIFWDKELFNDFKSSNADKIMIADSFFQEFIEQ